MSSVISTCGQQRRSHCVSSETIRKWHSLNLGTVPAVYYAHLASNRAKSHETLSANEPQHKNSDERERAELLKHKAVMDATGKQLSKSSLDKLRIWTRTEYPQLITMENKGKIRWGMWYI